MLRKDVDQWHVAQTLIRLWRSRSAHFVFVEGRAGTGKSFLAKYVTAEVAKSKEDIINVGTTGQAALQLPSGATAF